MKRYLLTLILCISFLYSDSSTSFIETQKLLVKTKKIIEEEEFIARAYEKFLLNEQKLPSSLAELKTDEYLGSTFSPTYFTNNDSKTFDIITRKNKMKNRLSLSIDDIKNNTGLSALYNNSAYRNRTYVDGDKIGIFLKDDFARHLYFLGSTVNFDILSCSDASSKKYCIKDDHMFIYNNDSKDKTLMYYKLSKFKTGPIIIIDDPLLYDDAEFQHIPMGALLYDIKGRKHIKTKTTIVRIQ